MFSFKIFGWNPLKHMGQAESSGATHGTGRAVLASGLVAGTQVATNMGWRTVEGIVPGDQVLTFDGGMQKVVGVERGQLWSAAVCPRHLWPLRVAKDVIGNDAELVLLPEQSVMIESDSAENLLGDPFALIPASALLGTRGVELMPPPHDLEVVILRFAQDQIVFANKGALFFCPGQPTPADMVQRPPTEKVPYRLVPQAQAQMLMASTYADATKPMKPLHAARSTFSMP